MKEEEKVTKIFKAYDIRGVYGEEFTEDIAEKTAKATADFLGAKRILVAMDARESSPSLKNSVIKSLVDSGVDVVFIGIATTPMFYFAINKEKTDGGIMITASHNPPKYNGLKISREKALPIGINSGLKEIKDMVIADKFEESAKKGKITIKNLSDDYVTFLSNKTPEININVLADFSCGASSAIVEKLSNKLNFKLSSLCKLGEKETHEGNPLKNENVVDLTSKMKKEKFDIGVAFDTDADRIFFFTEKGERIDSSSIASILSENYLKEQKSISFIGSVNISKNFKETVKQNKGSYLKSKVGHVFMKQAMRKNEATFGAELSGHFYFKDFFYADSGIFTFIKVLEIMQKTKKSISELTEKYNNYFRSGEINFEVNDKDDVLKRIEDLFSEGKISKIDGLSIEFEDFWFNVRASNTEPLLRVNMEADSEKLLKEKMDLIKTVIK